MSALNRMPDTNEAIKHLTAELVRVVMHASSVNRKFIKDPIPYNIASDLKFALEALDKYGDAEQVAKTTALMYVREDVRAALAVNITK
jgi:hypothetical protein